MLFRSGGVAAPRSGVSHLLCCLQIKKKHRQLLKSAQWSAPERGREREKTENVRDTESKNGREMKLRRRDRDRKGKRQAETEKMEGAREEPGRQGEDVNGRTEGG